MAHVPSDLQKVLEASAPPDVELLSKPMFGGIVVYADGRMFCSLSNVGLALKFGGDEHAALLKTKGAKALQYEPSMPPSKNYIVVPDAVLNDRKALRTWIAKSAAFVKTKPARKPRARKATTKR